MRTSSLRLPARAASLVVAAAVLASCTNTADETTTTTELTTTTTFAPIEIVPISTTVAPGVDPAVHEQLIGLLEELTAATQTMRGLSYIQLPAVAIVAADEFADRLAAVTADLLTDERLARDESVYRLLGQYDAPPSIGQSLRELYSADGAVAFYDGVSSEVVLDGTRAELTPLEASIVVRALAWALLDQYHDVFDRLSALEEAGGEDAIDAFRTLVEGDALAVQLRYLQSLSEDDQVAAALQAAESEPEALQRLPDVVRAQLALPGEAGVPFVEEIVAGGGYAALDMAYDPAPLSMEQLLHPERFAVGEPVRAVPELAVTIDGYVTVDDGSFGEWRLRLLLQDAIAPGLLTQTVSGWGGDAHQLLVNGDEMVFVYIYGGDTEDDAIEVAQALLALARGPLEAGDGIDSGGGVLWEGTDRWVYVDRIGDGLMFIVATDSAAGAAARGQIRVP
jgi:hypothetical protein